MEKQRQSLPKRARRSPRTRRRSRHQEQSGPEALHSRVPSEHARKQSDATHVLVPMPPKARKAVSILILKRRRGTPSALGLDVE